jgi:imidazolonepropionase-like amidohydrolase
MWSRSHLAMRGARVLLTIVAGVILLVPGSTVLRAQPASPARLVPAPPPFFNEPETIALTSATVIDGVRAFARRDCLVVIHADRIVYVGDAAAVRLGPRVKVKDLRGRWILPGFIDTHIHLPDTDNVVSFLGQLAAFGTTTARAAANPRVALRDAVASGFPVGPRLFVAGTLIDAAGSNNGGDSVRSVDEVRETVRRQAAQKVDFIKLYVGLTPPLVGAAIDEAHRLGLRVIGHLGETTWAEAAELGIDGLSHSWYAGLAHSVVPEALRGRFHDFYIPNPRFNPALFREWDDAVDPNGPDVVALADLLHRRHVEVHPNLVLGEAMTFGDDPSVRERLQPDFAPPAAAARWREGRHPYSASWSAEAMADAQLAFPSMVRLVRVLYERGVLLTAGTDYQNPWMTPGVAYHRELELLASAGIPPMDVLKIATRNGAEGLGLLKETGTVEAGKRADLVILTADPLANIANTRRVESVFLAGRWFEPATLLTARTRALLPPPPKKR